MWGNLSCIALVALDRKWIPSVCPNCNEFQKHCRGHSILTPEDPQKKKCGEIAKCTTSYKNCQCWVLLYILYDLIVSVCVLYLQPLLLFCIFSVGKECILFYSIWQNTSFQKKQNFRVNSKEVDVITDKKKIHRTEEGEYEKKSS